MINWTADSLLALMGVIVSLLFAYLPILKDWYDALDPRWKPMLQAGVLFVINAGYLAVVSRFDWATIQPQIGEYLGVFFAALVANQTTYQVAVRQVKQQQAENAALVKRYTFPQ